MHASMWPGPSVCARVLRKILPPQINTQMPQIKTKFEVNEWQKQIVCNE